MSDAAETKPDPTTSAPEETTKKAEETTTGTETSKVEEVKASAESATETAKDAAAKTSDTVFSMFGGGPKKEKKEDEEVDEPSGSSKAQKGEDEVSAHLFFLSFGYLSASVLLWSSFFVCEIACLQGQNFADIGLNLGQWLTRIPYL